MNILAHACFLSVYLSCLIITGALFLMLIAPRPWWKYNLASWLPLSFFLGITALTLAAFPLSIMNVPARLWMLWATAGIAGTGIMLNTRRIAAATDAAPRPAETRWAFNEIIFFGLGTLLLLMNLIVAMAYPQFDWDMMCHILIKGKILANTTYASTIYFHDPVFATLHGNYPPLTVFLHSFMFLFGATSIADYHTINYLALLGAGLLLHNALRTHIPAWQSLLWMLVLVSTNEFLATQFIMSSTDILLSLALVLITLNFLDAQRHADEHNEILSAVLCAIALLVKIDAVVFVAALCAGLWRQKRHFPLKHLIIIAVITGPWVIYRGTLPDPGVSGEYILQNLGHTLSLSTLVPVMKTIGTILWGNWNHLFLIVPLLWPLLASQKNLRPPLIACYATLITYALMTWFTAPTIPSYPQTFLRLLTHLYPTVILLGALALNAHPFPPDKKKTG